MAESGNEKGEANIQKHHERTRTSHPFYTHLRNHSNTILIRYIHNLHTTAKTTFIKSLRSFTFTKLRASGAGIVVTAGITAASLLAGMSVRTLSPVMRPATRAFPHLELVHAELVAGEGVDGRVRVRVSELVRREVTVQRRQ